MARLYESSSKPLSSASGRMLEGEFAEFGVKNQNGRIYPKDVYERALAKLMPKIREGKLLGECDHPDYDEVRLANVSHVIRECTVEGNKVRGKVELLNTPSGKLIQALREAGVPVGISSRGLGSTVRIKEGTEVTDLELITFDLVADPSFSQSYLSESKKSTLSKRLDSIERSLPLNESAGENQIIRDKISAIREGLSSSPSMSDELIETVGSLTERNLTLEEKLSAEIDRNKGLTSNMSKLQEGYNQLAAKVSSLEIDLKDERSKNDAKITELTESYDRKVLELSKELAIERRGLSKDTVMPLLEGLTSPADIEAKLNSLKHLGNRRYSSIPNEVLTEGSKGRQSTRLSSIISKV